MSFKRPRYPVLRTREGQLNYNSNGGLANTAYLYPLYLRQPTPIIGLEAIAKGAADFQLGIYRWTSFQQATAESLYLSPVYTAPADSLIADPVEQWLPAGYTWLAVASDTAGALGIATPRALDSDYAKVALASYPLPSTITILGGAIFIPTICVVTGDT